MMAVTAIPRMIPFVLLNGRTLSKDAQDWLGFVPVAVLSAILVPELLLHNGRIDLSFSNLYFWAAVPAFLAGIRSRNLFLTIVVGMGTLAFFRFF